MIPARTRATNFVLDVLERQHEWEFDVEAKATLFDEIEKLIEAAVREAVEDHDEWHLNYVPKDDVLVRRKER